MLQWAANFTNDPSNDYELMIEILYNSEGVGVIKHGKIGLEFILFAHSKDIVIPCDWLLGLMAEANTKLVYQHKE